MCARNKGHRERISTHQRAKANGPEVFISDFKNSIQCGHLKNIKNKSVIKTRTGDTIEVKKSQYASDRLCVLCMNGPLGAVCQADR